MQYMVEFPDPRLADDDGLVAVGGELLPEYLVSAYARGIFPWFSDGDPILWWSPNPRLVLYPVDFKVSKSLRQLIRSNRYEIRIDADFQSVIANCSVKERAGQEGSWITKEMINAYMSLHQLGLAHSFETYLDNQLVGGLYGVSLGKAFFGESMYFTARDASKFALYHLVDWCHKNDFHFIDAQQPTDHLKSLGAREIERLVFLEELDLALQYETIKGTWKL